MLLSTLFLTMTVLAQLTGLSLPGVVVVKEEEEAAPAAAVKHVPILPSPNACSVTGVWHIDVPDDEEDSTAARNVKTKKKVAADAQQWRAAETCKKSLFEFWRRVSATAREPVSIVALGDSTMERLVERGIKPLLEQECGEGKLINSAVRPSSRVPSQAPRQSLSDYLRLSPSCPGGRDTVDCIEGGTNGTAEVQLDTSSLSEAQLWAYTSSMTNRSCSFEFLRLQQNNYDGAASALFSSREGPGTVRTVLYHLSLAEAAPQAVCLVNTGMHEMRRFNNLSNVEAATAWYVGNTHKYVLRLLRSCQRVIYLSTNAIREGPDDLHWPQRNSVIVKWNSALKQCFERKEFGQRVYFLDVFNMSFNVQLHADNVHMKPVYYRTLADILFGGLQIFFQDLRLPSQMSL